jgi:NAD(P)-dependent dehydrogenase (short-subunit alcohol dehydrogenase family)
MTVIPAAYRPAATLLQDRVVLVTGAGGGLGRAVALACAQHGARLILLGRTVAGLEAVYDAIKAGGGPEPALYPMNLAGAAWQDYEELAATLGREFGRLDGLAHCAAHFKGYTPLAATEARDWLDALQVNVTAPFALTRHCLPLLEQAGDGSVVLVADACGRRGKAYSGAYGVSKFALEGLMQTWAQELESAGRVRINTLDPGPMDTALRRRGYADRAGTRDPAIAAAALLWLLGPDSRATSGQALSLP